MNAPSITNNWSYKKLRHELRLCKIGGLFLALYRQENTPQYIIQHLQKDLPENFEFPLQMDDDKVIFSIFFGSSFEQIGQHSNIFHVLGVEQLSEQSIKKLLHYLQYGRELFSAKPYSLVFWLQPELEKQLFFAAPDFHHWVTGTYDFTEVDAIEEAAVSPPIPFHKVTNYLENVIWQYEHWKEVKKSEEDFLIEVMGRANLHEYYVASYCTDKKGRTHSLDKMLQQFLAENSSHFLTLLGDFGTGKSSFSLHYYIHLARLYLEDNTKRIPIFISLKGYPGLLNIEQFILQEFYQKFDITLSFDIFQNLALQGKFAFFIDGFDEMASLSNQELTIQNFKELTKLTFENVLFMTEPSGKTKKANKVFLTCRTHYFLSEIQEKELLRADYTVLFRNYATKSNYELARIHLQKFNNQQVKKYVFKNTRDAQETKTILSIIKDTYNLQGLSTRPLLLEMIVKTIPALKGKGTINAASLYQAYTDIWIEREDWRSQMTVKGKRHFMWQLALKMLNKGGGDFSLHYSELDEPHINQFKKNVEKEEDYYRYETTTCSFLHRDSEGNYKFIHKSFMEYFLAECFFDAVEKKKKRVVDYELLNEETKFFLKLVVLLNKKILHGLDLNGLSLTKIDLNDTDLRQVDLSKAYLSEADLHGANLSKANLREANLREANLHRAYLSKAYLSRANLCGTNLNETSLGKVNLSKANMRNVKLKNADLREANLSGADLLRADLSGADLSGADLSGADLSGAYPWYANLYETNLSRADLSKANLREAYLSQADLCEANLSETNLHRTNLFGTDLSGADLSGADLSGANLSKTDLSGADLSGADLSGANLSGANLSKADLNEANLWNADLSGVDLSEANLSKANLNDAYLWQANLSGANLRRTNLSGVDLHRIDLFETDLREAYLANALYSIKTQFPDGFNPAQHNMILIPSENQKSTEGGSL